MPKPGGVPVDPSVDSLERSLTRLVRLVDPRPRSDDADGAACSLDRAAYAALARIEELGGVRLTELAHVLSIDISTASRQVRSLEAQGLLKRNDVEGDLRTRMIELSPEGAVALAAVRVARRNRIATRVANWSAEDLADLAALLGRLVTSYSDCAEPTSQPTDAATTLESASR